MTQFVESTELLVFPNSYRYKYPLFIQKEIHRMGITQKEISKKIKSYRYKTDLGTYLINKK